MDVGALIVSDTSLHGCMEFLCIIGGFEDCLAGCNRKALLHCSTGTTARQFIALHIANHWTTFFMCHILNILSFMHTSGSCTRKMVCIYVQLNLAVIEYFFKLLHVVSVGIWRRGGLGEDSHSCGELMRYSSFRDGLSGQVCRLLCLQEERVMTYVSVLTGATGIQYFVRR